MYSVGTAADLAAEAAAAAPEAEAAAAAPEAGAAAEAAACVALSADMLADPTVWRPVRILDMNFVDSVNWSHSTRPSKLNCITHGCLNLH